MKEKILVLEDEIGIRSFVSINLKREGYEIIEAGSGSEAIEKITEHNDISIALLDVMLPDMSGIEVCKYIRPSWYNNAYCKSSRRRQARRIYIWCR